MEQKELELVLKNGALTLGIDLNEESIERFFTYLRELKAWNKKINLTSITSDKEIIIRHFLDSLTAYSVIKGLQGNPPPLKLLDIGAGAGFPGIPIKVVNPGIDVTLIDSVEKKVHFIRHIIRVLGLPSEGIRAISGRAEDKSLIEKYPSYFDCVISRAFSRLKNFLELGMPYCRKGGLVIAIKGPAYTEELKEVKGRFQAPEVLEIKIPFSNRVNAILSFRKQN